MSDYVIKHYHEGFEVDQEKVGKEVAKTFVSPHQTPAERLKEVYTQEGFDPETRLYAFKDKKMVGFLTARVLDEEEDGVKIANLTPPSVLAGHEEAEKLLFKKAVEILKKKGAKKVRSNFGVITKQDGDVAKKWGYKYKETGYYLYNINVDDVDTSISMDDVEKFEYDKHQQACVKILAAEFGREEEWVNNLYERMKADTTNVRKQWVIKDKDEIKAYGGIMINPIDESLGRVIVTYAASEEYMKKLLAKFRKVKDKKGLKKLFAGFTEEGDVKEAKYKPIKFELLGTASLFELDL
ncbi:MAG: hypothetical protein JJE41_00625 [Candidatus Heimdallarchaeota archaeon]|nr:hypothetical protein [Candidatus Heimdallarchaeota archaeon]